MVPFPDMEKYLSVTNGHCSISGNNRFNNLLEIMPSEEFGTCPTIFIISVYNQSDFISGATVLLVTYSW